MNNIGGSEIYEPNENQNYWVVRADSGTYFDHFIRHGIVAIGHLNEILKHNYDPVDLRDHFGILYSRAENYYSSDEFNTAQRRASLSQIRSFIEFMKPGDLVITMRSGEIRVGRILGHAYVNLEAKEIVYDAGTPYERQELMELYLQRAVAWGPDIKRTEFPFRMRKALSAHLTVFSVNEYWKELHHMLYPIFRKGENLYFSLAIKQELGIRNAQISPLFAFLTEAEAIARIASSGAELSDKDFESTVGELLDADALNLETKAQFMSPGDVWGAMTSLNLDQMIYFYVVYSAIFGSKKLGWKGMVNPASVPKLVGKCAIFAWERWKKKNGEKIAEQLKIQPPTFDTKVLNDKTKDAAALPPPKKTRKRAVKKQQP